MSRRLLSLVNACLRACPPARALVLCVLVLGAAATPARAQSSTDPVYVFHTSLGNISVQLYPDVAPQTVANFLHYVTTGAYNNSFIHRSPPGFVIQGGGYTFPNGQVQTITAFPPVVNEFHLSNTRGTIAMAKVGNDPNSATSQWFFNESDSNAANLDNQNGGFTVFGKVTDAASLAVMDQIAAVPVSNQGSPFDHIPLINNYQSGAAVQASNLIFVSSITPATVHTHLLWNDTDGRVMLWSLAADGSFTLNGFGPYTDGAPQNKWSATAVATGADGVSHLLWNNTDGRVMLWTVNDAGTFTLAGYGPYTDGAPQNKWSATAVSVGPDNVVHLLWSNTDNRAMLWSVQSDFSFTLAGFGPYTDDTPQHLWSATALSTGPDGLSHILWNNTDNRVMLWDVNPDSSFTLAGFGPYTDGAPQNLWSAAGISVGPDNVQHILWTNTDRRAMFWDVNPDFSFTLAGFGPYTDDTPQHLWSAQAVATGPDGMSHLLWGNTDNRAMVWGMDSAFNFTVAGFGPYTDNGAGNPWSVTAVSAGP